MAFEKSGGRCVFSSEWNKFSQQTYEANFIVEDEAGGTGLLTLACSVQHSTIGCYRPLAGAARLPLTHKGPWPDGRRRRWP